ncbi:MAG TPA: hypothetical protein VGJ97_03090 [Anaerolineaceae bacterium]|jgi:hypothetical protein
MTVATDWLIEIPIEEVFQAQQTDMARIRERRPELYEVTVQATRDALVALRPVAIYQPRKIVSLERSGIHLEGGLQLSGRFAAKRFGAAEEIIAAVCTIGDGVEKLASRAMADGHAAYGYALDTAGCVALNRLISQVYRQLEEQADRAGKKVTSRFGPGTHSWPVMVGQPQIFAILTESAPFVHLTARMQMLPVKSGSFVVGVGEHVTRQGSECDDCDARERCSFRELYVAANS